MLNILKDCLILDGVVCSGEPERARLRLLSDGVGDVASRKLVNGIC
jgi:hypothetical protein